MIGKHLVQCSRLSLGGGGGHIAGGGAWEWGKGGSHYSMHSWASMSGQVYPGSVCGVRAGCPCKFALGAKFPCYCTALNHSRNSRRIWWRICCTLFRKNSEGRIQSATGMIISHFVHLFRIKLNSIGDKLFQKLYRNKFSPMCLFFHIFCYETDLLLNDE